MVRVEEGTTDVQEVESTSEVTDGEPGVGVGDRSLCCTRCSSAPRTGLDFSNMLPGYVLTQRGAWGVGAEASRLTPRVRAQ